MESGLVLGLGLELELGLGLGLGGERERLRVGDGLGVEGVGGDALGHVLGLRGRRIKSVTWKRGKRKTTLVVYEHVSCRAQAICSPARR